MTNEKIDMAVAEAQRFIDRAEAYQADEQRRAEEHRALEERLGRECWRSPSGALSASVRRASMDLTRALSDMRRRGQRGE